MEEQEIVKRLLIQPETYRSMLGCDYGRNSSTILLRKKILRAIKWGWINRIYLNGSRGGEVLFLHKDKKYNILITMEHNIFKYYYCDSIKDIDHMKILAKNCRLLQDCKWIVIGDNELFKGKIIKVL